MKDKVLLDKLRVATIEAKLKEEESKIAEQEKLKKIQRDKARKEVEKKFKNFENRLMQEANSGSSYEVVEIIKTPDFSNWDLHIQESFKFLQDKGFEPEVRERKEGDIPRAYSTKEAPYFIIVSWEE